MIRREEVFDEIYQAIETLFLDESINTHQAQAFNTFPSYDEGIFPCVVLSQFDYALDGEALNKAKQKHRFSIEAQVFAINTSSINKREICNDVAYLIEDVVVNNYGLTLISAGEIPNLDEGVYRIVLRFSGLVDDETKIIYRE